MRRIVTLSTFLRLIVLLLVYVGLPTWFSAEDEFERPLPVTLYMVRDDTVLPPPRMPEPEAEAEAEPEPEPELEKEPVPIPPAPDVAYDAPPPPPEPTPSAPEPAPRVAEAVVAPPPPTIPVSSDVPPPPPPKPIHVAKLKPKPKPVPEPMLDDKPAPPDPLASLLKSVMDSARQAIKLEQTQAKAHTT